MLSATKKRTGFIGVDIGTHAVKLAQVERRGDSYMIVDATQVPRRVPWEFADWNQCLPQPSWNEIVAGHSISKLIQGNAAAATVSMAMCDVRKLEMQVDFDEQTNLDSIAKTLEAVERFGSEQRSFDFWELNPNWAQHRPGLYVLSMRQSWANRVAEDMTSSRLKCKVLDGMPLAIGRAVEMVRLNSNSPIAVIDWGFTRATFSLVLHGQPVFVRVLRGSGFQELFKAITSQLKLNTSQAQQLIREQGLSAQGTRASRSQQMIKAILQAPLKKMAGELDRTLKYLSGDRQNPMPEEIMILGGGAMLHGVTDWIESVSELPVTRWRIPTTTALDTKQVPLSLFGPAVAMSALAWSKE